MAKRPIPWPALLMGALVASAALGVIGWRLSLQELERQTSAKRASLKKLTLSGGLPPNQQVMEYLQSRQQSLERSYQHWVKAVAVPPVADAASANPQLYFQERFREGQRMLERLASARGLTVPELLGFPKELPPSDTVPRLLMQLSLIQEAAGLVFAQGVGSLASLKVEDPESVLEDESQAVFVLRLPIRVRLAGTMPQIMKALGAMERAQPLIDVRALRVANNATAEDQLDAELLLARYVVIAAAPESLSAEEEERAEPTITRKGARSSTRSSRSAASNTTPSTRKHSGDARPSSDE